MSRLVREGDDEYIVYNDEERRLAMEIAHFAVWLFVIWLPLRLFVFHFLAMDAIGIILVIVALSGFSKAVEGRVKLNDD
jgi:hypothetical protein